MVSVVEAAAGGRKRSAAQRAMVVAVRRHLSVRVCKVVDFYHVGNS